VSNDPLETLLKQMDEAGGSDLHLKNGAPARMRLNGEIVVLGASVLDADAMEAVARRLVGADGFDQLQKAARGIDTYYLSGPGKRYRVNLFLHIGGIAAVLRAIAETCLPLEALGLPNSVDALTKLARGLVLVTGSTGSGKSTTLAAMVDRINRREPKHIITIEDPVEFIHADAQGIIEQRSVGEHVEDFSSALKDALREDPDIILVGEMRDMETIRMALHAANTGHLVFSTLHTVDAKETVSRIIGVFPPGEQNHVRVSLAAVLQGVVSQRLVKGCDGRLHAAVEIMRVTARVRDLMLRQRDDELQDVITEGAVHGMQSFDQALLALTATGKITPEEALTHATQPADLDMMLDRYREQSAETAIALKETEDEMYDSDAEELPRSAAPRTNLLMRFK
jgi:twitching motility protein PilT